MASDSSSHVAVTCRQPAVIMVHLPFDQHSKVALESGFTVEEKIGRKLHDRLVPTEACSIREKRKSGEERIVNWNEDLSRLDSDSELTVVLMYPKLFNPEHKIIKQSGFSMMFCKFCTKRIYIHAYRCDQCDVTFHQKCCLKLPVYCNPAEKNSHNQQRKIKFDNSIQTNVNYQNSSIPKTIRNNETFNQNKIKTISDDVNLPDKRKGLENWEIASSSVRKDRRIGEGSFGYVYKGVWYGAVAVKTVRTSVATESVEALKNEFEILKTIRHPNILVLKGWLREPRLGIVTQWCDNLSLYKHLHVNEPPTKFSTSETVNISKQIAQGMGYLHSKDILHRDLKSNNIFLTDDMTVKIGDFGLATLSASCSQPNQSRELNGSLLWMAPEVIRMAPSGFYSDVYSFGIVLYELVSGCLPYSEIIYRDQILFCVGRGTLKPDLAKCRSDMPSSLKNLIKKCTDFQHTNRPDFKMILTELCNVFLPKTNRSTSVLFSTEKADEISYTCVATKKDSLQQLKPDAYISQKRHQPTHQPVSFVKKCEQNKC